LILLSASVGELDRARDWLRPCEVARVSERLPPLRQEVWELPEGEEAADQAVRLHAGEVLRDPSAQLLVFVYQTRSAEKLAREFQHVLGELAGCEGPLAYQGQMAPSRREAVRQAFLSGRSRCLVATTALGLGVNLPASHVLVRDTTFPGVGPLGVADLLQMMGRAGRGDREGHAVALVRPRDSWTADDLATSLREGHLPGLVSSLDRRQPGERKRGEQTVVDRPTAASPVLARLLRQKEQGLTLEEMRGFFAGSLGGRSMPGQVGGLLAWLCDPAHCLAYRDEQGRYHPTVLGRRAGQAMLPLDLAAGAAQLVRDLLSADESDRLLAGWQPLDHLLLLELLSPHSLPGRRFSEKLAEQVDGWIEGRRSSGSLLYREWIRGGASSSRAGEVLGSLGVSVKGRGPGEGVAREAAYMAVLRGAVLIERASGREVADVERHWGLSGLDGIEERWRDDVLWLLSGWARLLEVRCFYYHMREACSADNERVQRVEGVFRRMRSGAFELREQLNYCSTLGPILRSLRRTRKSAEGVTIGVQTVRRLENAGVRSVADLAKMSVEDLISLQIRRSLAQQISAYVMRRLT
jgi:hypothetical protein